MKTNFILFLIFAMCASINAQVTIGKEDTYGGYIFILAEDGMSGVVAANQDQAEWVEYPAISDSINNPDKHDETGANFSDWRLPTLSELESLCAQKSDIGGFKEDWDHSYWSSTDMAAYPDSAMLLVMIDCSYWGNSYSAKTGRWYSVRAVRDFTVTATNLRTPPKNETISIYPNPAQNNVTVEFTDRGKYTIELYNSLGQLVQSIPDVSVNRTIDISKLQRSFYFVKIHQNGEEIKTKKLFRL